MYVYECPESSISNERTTYISYLDRCASDKPITPSVRFLTPPSYRKPIYQEVVASYLSYAHDHGFNTAHIWVCPPKRGDDYIMSNCWGPLSDRFSHPQEQKTPLADRLQRWYQDILTTAHSRGSVFEVTNMVDEYMCGKYNCK